MSGLWLFVALDAALVIHNDAEVAAAGARLCHFLETLTTTTDHADATTT